MLGDVRDQPSLKRRKRLQTANYCCVQVSCAGHVQLLTHWSDDITLRVVAIYSNLPYIETIVIVCWGTMCS